MTKKDVLILAYHYHFEIWTNEVAKHIYSINYRELFLNDMDLDNIDSWDLIACEDNRDPETQKYNLEGIFNDESFTYNNLTYKELFEKLNTIFKDVSQTKIQLADK